MRKMYEKKENDILPAASGGVSCQSSRKKHLYLGRFIPAPKGRGILRPNDKLEKAIGVFDSGFGGLEVLKQITKVLPSYSYIYLGDTARAPYGARSQSLVYHFTQQAVDFLFKQNCQLIIIACNTASSEGLQKIQREYLPKHYPSRRVLGVIIPAVEQAAEMTKNNRVGVIATEGAVTSGTFVREFRKINPKIQIFQKACPLLVPIVEAGEDGSQFVKTILGKYLQPLLKKNIDTLVLGCTHYGLLQNKIKEIVGTKVYIVSEGKVVAGKLKDYLERHPEIESKLLRKRNVKFYTTDLTEKFKVLGGRFFGRAIFPKKVIID